MSENAKQGFVPIEALQNASAHDDQPFDGTGIAISESSRRRFLSLMAGSMALAGITGCTRQPAEPIMPYVEQPENVVPGKPKYYATAVPVNGVAEGVIVESHLGRPTKVEGNPDHPASLGASSVLSQACLMDLYDADRMREITSLGIPREWEAFESEWTNAARALSPNSGAGFRILSETVTSPTLGAQIQAVLKKYPSAKWHQYDPAGPHSARKAAQIAFGRPVNTYYNFADADVVLALDSDFLVFGNASTRYARDFAARRRHGNRLDMNRLYAIESTMTATGGKADHRLAVRYTEVQGTAEQIATQLDVAGVNGAASGPHRNWVSAVTNDLAEHKGKCVVVPGEHQSLEVHALAHAINAALGNAGKTVFYTDPLEIEPTDQIQSLRELSNDLKSGRVQLLLILGGNPVYNAPADFEFTKALENAKTSVHVATQFNETSLKTTWHVPEPHFLEDWGDTRAYDGTISIVQPLIAPLHDSHSQLKVLDAILQWPGRSSYEIVRSYWAGKSEQKNFEHWWRKSIHDGLVANSALDPITPALKEFALHKATESGSLELVFRPDVYLYDGRYANNVWLQELPHPMTKLTWDNAVFISTNTARRLGLENQEKVDMRLRDKSVEGSVWILPGHPDDSVTVDLGWGRTHAGRAGDGAGFNAYLLRVSDAMWRVHGVELRKLGKSYPLATTQMQQAMEGRDIVIHSTLDEYKNHPDFAKRKEHEPPENLTLYPHWDYRGYAWAMSIDATACVNCQACVIACQAENNIPVVGKDQVLARRAMHWLRVDVYYEGGYQTPAAHYAPVPCMHCENAPCEVVCPTAATNHSSEGLNNMVYNRCVGTRYCSNNCPYKVRRFNFLLYQDWRNELWEMQRNPDVTVRSRGVMEKCTYCVQRIREAEITAEKEGRPVRDGEIKTACQQACPTEAIIFGDKNNPQNLVAKRRSEKLNYSMLSDLNTRPRTTYLAELCNPNPALKEGTSA